MKEVLKNFTRILQNFFLLYYFLVYFKTALWAQSSSGSQCKRERKITKDGDNWYMNPGFG